MSFNIAVGLLVEADNSLRDKINVEGLESEKQEIREDFEELNRFLMSIGRPKHDEPTRFDGRPMYINSLGNTYSALLAYARHIEQISKYTFPHLLLGNPPLGVMYLPQAFDEPFRPGEEFDIGYITDSDSTGYIGSSQRLYKECCILAKILGVYDDIVTHQIHDSKERELTERINKLCGFDEHRDYKPIGTSPQPTGAPMEEEQEGCGKLLMGARLSVQYGAALFLN